MTWDHYISIPFSEHQALVSWCGYGDWRQARNSREADDPEDHPGWEWWHCQVYDHLSVDGTWGFKVLGFQITIF